MSERAIKVDIYHSLIMPHDIIRFSAQIDSSKLEMGEIEWVLLLMPETNHYTFILWSLGEDAEDLLR
jgi:hypothetical protein